MKVKNRGPGRPANSSKEELTGLFFVLCGSAAAGASTTRMEMREINSIIIHCSASDFGDDQLIDQWHKEEGWDGIGYHFVITNGVFWPRSEYKPENDGLIQYGRDIEKQGAHCKGYNKDSIGICLIGNHHFTGQQLYNTLPVLLSHLMDLYAILEDKIFGHRDFNMKKTCPNIDTKLIRSIITGSRLLLG